MSWSRLAIPALVGATAQLCGCSESGTGGEAVQLEMAVVGVPDAGEELGTFTTRTGYRVQLSEARVAIGPIYLYENPPPVARSASPLRRAWDALVPSAHAHPGDLHFAGGAVRGEYLGQVVLDGLAGERLDLGVLQGVAGPARSFSVILEPPRSTEARTALRDHHAYVVGTAEKDGASYSFEGGLDIESEGALRKVEGIGLEAEIQQGARVTIQLHLSRWFADADFARLSALAPSGRYVIDEQSQVRGAWFIGARSFDTFSASVE
jgi:hypothetical protein